MLVRSFAAAALAVAVIASTSEPAWALLVQPIVMDLTTSGTGSSGAISIVNDRSDVDSVEITVSKLDLPESGNAILTPDSGDNFLIFPPTSSIPAGKTQVLRVRWIGDPEIKQSQTYMFTISELPVARPGNTNTVQVVYSIQTLVTVTSANLKSDTTVIGAVRDAQVPAGAKEGTTAQPGAVVEFANAGNGIDYISHYQVTFSVAGSNWTKTFDGPEMSKAVGLGLVEPNGKRKIFFPIADLPPTGDITVKLQAAATN